jgi:two-component system phosphate regulon sensor histidine kinase PhoR
VSGLRFRITASYVFLIVLAFAALAVYIPYRTADGFRHAHSDDLASEAQLVANLVRPMLESGASRSDLDAVSKQIARGTGTRVTVLRSDGTVVGDSEADPSSLENHAERPEVKQALQSGEGRDSRHSASLDQDLTYVAVRLDLQSGVAIVRVSSPTEAVDAALGDIERSLIVAILLGVASAIVLGSLIASSTLRPLAWISDAASAISRGDLTARVERLPSGEVGMLADVFNGMADNLQSQMAEASRERQRLEAALNASIDGYAALDRDLMVLFANDALHALLDRARTPDNDVVGHPLVWSLPDERVLDNARNSRDHGQPSVALIERPGRRFYQVATTPIASGGPWAVLIVLHDLTDVRRAELQRRDFVGNVSHELRTPLAALRSVVETLQDGALEDRPAAEDFLRRADQEVERLINLVEELLELSRIESGELPLDIQPVDVQTLLGEALELARPEATRRRVELKLDVNPELGVVELDAKHIDRAVFNLVQNAIKFTPPAGSVTVRAQRIDDSLEVAVSDTGIGIAASDLPRVFERFYKVDQSRASGGTGLGLALVKHAVEAHGGQVSAESRIGVGSTFRFVIPIGGGGPEPTASVTT